MATSYIGLTSAIALSVGFGGNYGVIASIGASAIALIAGEFIIHQQKPDANDGSTTTPVRTPH